MAYWDRNGIRAAEEEDEEMEEAPQQEYVLPNEGHHQQGDIEATADEDTAEGKRIERLMIHRYRTRARMNHFNQRKMQLPHVS